MANDVVWYDSTETGAPTLNNAAGSLDAVLYACLVTGFRVLTLDSVDVASGVATATYTAGHGYSNQRVLEISGAATGAINGRKLITTTGAGSFTFPAPGVSDGTIGGTIGGAITAKRASLGWTRPRNSGNVSIYQRTDVTATGMALRLDDSGAGVASATTARALMVESHTAINAFTGPTPPASQYSGSGVYIPKGSNDTNPKKWILVGDGRTLYMFTEAAAYPAPSYLGMPQGIWTFGDIEAHRPGDPYACIVAGASGDGGVDSQGLGAVQSITSGPGSFQCMLVRPFNGIGAPVRAGMVGMGSGSGTRRLGGGGPAYPSPVDNGVAIHTPLLVNEENAAFSSPFRGHMRGIGDPLANIPGGLLHLQVLDNVVGSDRRWLFVGFQQQGSYGHAAFDITGPW